MSEKVWFKISEKQLRGLVKYEHKHTRETLSKAIEKQKLAPVVSVERIKEEIETMINYSMTALPPSKFGEFREGYLLALHRAKDRLVAVEKQAGEKK